MSGAGESGRVQQMRARVQDLEQAAERATDPAERQQLKDKARQLKEQSEHAGGTGKQDVDPDVVPGTDHRPGADLRGSLVTREATGRSLLSPLKNNAPAPGKALGVGSVVADAAGHLTMRRRPNASRCAVRCRGRSRLAATPVTLP
ncbi:DUF6381 family protein [Streptomyces sp. NPDC055059]